MKHHIILFRWAAYREQRLQFTLRAGLHFPFYKHQELDWTHFNSLAVNWWDFEVTRFYWAIIMWQWVTSSRNIYTTRQLACCIVEGEELYNTAHIVQNRSFRKTELLKHFITFRVKYIEPAWMYVGGSRDWLSFSQWFYISACP